MVFVCFSYNKISFANESRARKVFPTSRAVFARGPARKITRNANESPPVFKKSKKFRILELF